MSKPLPISYKAIGTPTVPVTLTAAFAGNTKTLFSNDFKALQLDVTYTPEATKTTRYIEILIEFLDEDAVVVGRKSIFVEDVSGMAGVYSQLEKGVYITVPGEKAEGTGLEIKASYALDICAYSVKISARENDSTGEPSDKFGSAYVQARLFNNN